MRSLYLRIWLTVVAALALFALVSGWVWQRQIEQERARFETVAAERATAWAELVQRSLPGPDAPPQEQAEALREWSFRLRMPMAMDDTHGRRIAASESFLRRELEGGPPPVSVRLDDGRTLWMARRVFRRPTLLGDAVGQDAPPPPDALPRRDGAARADGPRVDGSLPGALRLPAPGARVSMLPQLSLGLPSGLGPVLLLGLLFLAVAAGAYPVVRRLTRRLEALKAGVEAFGAGKLGQRVEEGGTDEVAAVAVTFNRAAERIETLVRSHQSLLANASHELRSPLARLKMAVALYGDASENQRPKLRQEIDANVAELDALVEEVLLASRLDATPQAPHDDSVDLLVVAAEEAARVGAQAGGDPVMLKGSERLLRRALRNLLENARRYGGSEVSAELKREGREVEVRISDRGPGVPEPFRERIFEPFFRLPGHAEREGGVGLGLSLVRQIAEHHRGSVRCEARPGGGSCFVLRLPAT